MIGDGARLCSGFDGLACLGRRDVRKHIAEAKEPVFSFLNAATVRLNGAVQHISIRLVIWMLSLLLQLQQLLFALLPA
jgi:hypothetical protein